MFTRSLLAATLACAAPLFTPAFAQGQSLPATVVKALADLGIPSSAVGAYVQDVAATRPILAVNDGQPMNPASVMKLVTTWAALELLGPNYTWRTEALTRANLSGDVLEGDLHLRGSGDPKLTLENFWLFLRSLRARGIREIRGDLVFDRGLFEAAEIDPGRFDNEPLRPYNVGPDPLLVNFKSVRIQFFPEGDRVRVVSEPRLPQLEIDANVRTSNGGCGAWRAGIKADIQNQPRSARLTFSGAMPASCGERSWYLGLLNHPEFVYGTFKSLWEESGGVLRGGWRDGAVPAGARVLATTESPPLTEIIRDINKFSNNVMTRQLFLTLSAELTKLPGRADRSGRAVQTWLKEQNIEIPELVMENGSGLSREERISAGSMGRMLVAAFRSAVMPEFVSSMPLMSHDGTMRTRMRHESIAGNAHIKTGGLTGVRTIAGYVRDSAGRRLAVAYFVNHPAALRAVAAENAFLRWVHEDAAGR